MNSKNKKTNFFVHETSIIDKSVLIGENTKIWHFSHIMKNAKIGSNCTFGQNTHVGPEVIVGNNCKIQNNVSLYKGIILKNNVFCGPSCVFTNVLNPRAEFERKDEFKETVVRNGATIGANVTIICGITLNEYCLIGAGSTVTKDVPAYALMLGSPTRRAGWVSKAGYKLNEHLECPITQARFKKISEDQIVEL